MKTEKRGPQREDTHTHTEERSAENRPREEVRRETGKGREEGTFSL